MKRQTEERAKEETAAEAERTLARRTGQEGGAAAVKLESGAHGGGWQARERLLSSAKSLSAFLEFEASLWVRMGLSCVADTDLGGTLYFRARKKRYSAVLKSMVSDHFELCIRFLLIRTQR